MSDEQHQSEVYFGSATDMVTGQQPAVELIKFNAIPVDTPHIMLQLNEEKFNTTKNDNLRSLSAIDLSDSSSPSGRKWPWTTTKTIDAKSDSSAPNLAANLTSSQQKFVVTNEPFQVVWRRLSFEVSTSSYKQMIDGALARVTGLWCVNKSENNTHSPKDLVVNTNGQLNDQFRTSIDYDSRNKKRVIFENLNGHINSSEITAILGPSGSGKTSLLNAISSKVENYRGSVQLIGGGKRRMRLSIIPQKDYLMENLTVRENLQYSSRILNTDKEFNHEANIMRVVKMLNLTHCFKSSAANISGGEYKRVSIAQELLKQPDILIMDEPTSGLDSLNCKNLIRSLVKLIEASRSGTINPIAIVMTIHQPDVDIFQMFDHVYCMARRGRVVFDGHPSEVMNVLYTHAGFLPDQMPVGMSGTTAGMSINPANLLIEIASEDLYGQEPIDRLAFFQRRQFELQTGNAITILSSSKTTTTSENFITIDLQQPTSSSLVSTTSSNLSGASSSSYASSSFTKVGQFVRDKRLNAKNDNSGNFWHHTNLLARRAFRSTVKDPLMTLISLIFHLTIPFVLWTVYSRKIGTVRACPVIQRDMDMVSLISNYTMGKMGEQQEELMTALECSTMFFLSTYSFSMCSISVAALAFPLNMHVLLKEVRNGWYSLPSYVVAKTIANFPFEVLFPAISLAMIYVMLGMPSSYLEWRLLATALVMALISMVSHTQGLIFGALFMDSVQTAIFLAIASSLPQILLSGFTARIKQLPVLLQKLSWLSVYRYSSDSINMIRFGFGTCPCNNSTDEYLRTKVPSFSDIPAKARPLFTYYLTNTAPGNEPSPSVVSDDGNSTMMMETTNSTLSNVLVNNATNFVKDLIPGVSYDLTLDPAARSKLISKIETEEIDLFGRMANLMARSFTYGREVNNCESVRSELLLTADAPEDEYLPLLLGGMFGLLVAAKLILFVIVKLKIGSRV